jgi:hypothetical protein
VRWQSKEIKWVSHLHRRCAQPLLSDELNIPANKIEKCPSYKSKEMGGVTPSGPYLIHMFCHEIERLRKQLDAECIKWLAMSLLLLIDASYKVCFLEFL